METQNPPQAGPARLAPASSADDVRDALQHPVFEARTLPENGASHASVGNAPVESEARAATRRCGPLGCSNCGTARAESGDYCHSCGQEFLGGRLTLWRFWHEFAERYLKLENGLWRTFRELCTDPGGVAARYVEGRRRRYINPLGYFLLAATVSVLALTLVEPIFKERMLEQTRQFNAQLYGPGWEADGQETFSDLFPDADDPMRAYIDFYTGFQKQMNTYLSLLLCVSSALLLRWFFPGPKQGGHTLAEMLVFSTFVVGHGMLLTLPFTYGLTLADFSFGMSATMVLGVGVYVALAAWAARAFFGQRLSSSLLAGMAMGVAYAAFFLATVTLAVTVMMWDLLVELAEVLIERAV